MRAVQGIGELQQDSRVPGWWVSRPVPVPFCAGLPLRFAVTEEAWSDGRAAEVDEAVAAFLSLGEGDRLLAAPRVLRNYEEFAAVSTCPALSVRGASEIWNFVAPREVVVERRWQDGRVYVVLACECEWEVEHGLQLVFERGNRLVRVSEQDGHLAHEDAGAPPETDGG